MGKRVYYTTDGDIRGCCGHKHRSIDAAIRCLTKDSDGCATQGGYSDRTVVRHDGAPLTDEEQDEFDATAAAIALEAGVNSLLLGD